MSESTEYATQYDNETLNTSFDKIRWISYAQLDNDQINITTTNELKCLAQETLYRIWKRIIQYGNLLDDPKLIRIVKGFANAEFRYASIAWDSLHFNIENSIRSNFRRLTNFFT